MCYVFFLFPAGRKESIDRLIFRNIGGSAEKTVDNCKKKKDTIFAYKHNLPNRQLRKMGSCVTTSCSSGIPENNERHLSAQAGVFFFWSGEKKFLQTASRRKEAMDRKR